MSYADMNITDADHDLIDKEIVSLTNEFGVRAGEEAEGCLFSVNPAHKKEIVAQFVYQVESNVSRTIFNAKQAYRSWGRDWEWHERSAIMRKFFKNVSNNLHRLVAAVILETGKSRMESLAEVKEFTELMEYYLETYNRSRGLTEMMDVERAGHSFSQVVYKPFGVFAAITPFNFPVAMAGMCFGALLTGNTVVWKPAPETPLTGYLLHQCFPADIKDVFNFVVCEEGLFGNLVLNNSDLVDGLAFTGSTEVGQYLGDAFTTQKRKDGPRKFIAEMGGNNPCVVTPSADIEAAGWGIAKSAFGACAQKCSACGRVIAHESIENDLISAVIEASIKMFVIGDPRDRKMTLGPVINDRSFNRHGEYLHDIWKADARRMLFPLGLADGNLKRRGYFVEPVIVSDLPKNHHLLKKELFVPILRVQTYRNIEEALQLANDTEYGLTAGIYTQDDQEITYFFKHIQAGVTYVNRRDGATTGAWPRNQAFGGWKNSGWCTQHGVCGPNYLFNFVRGQSQYDATLRKV